MHNILSMNIIRILFAVVALIVSTACERDSVIDVGQEKTTPIMTAYFYRDSSLLVNVYSSVSFYSSAYCSFFFHFLEIIWCRDKTGFYF